MTELLCSSSRRPCVRTVNTLSVDGAEEKGYVKLPPLEEAVAPNKPCRASSALADRAYSAAGQAASALHIGRSFLDKISFLIAFATQYSFPYLSGNRGYVSNLAEYVLPSLPHESGKKKKKKKKK